MTRKGFLGWIAGIAAAGLALVTGHRATADSSVSGMLPINQPGDPERFTREALESALARYSPWHIWLECTVMPRVPAGHLITHICLPHAASLEAIAEEYNVGIGSYALSTTRPSRGRVEEVVQKRKVVISRLSGPGHPVEAIDMLGEATTGKSASVYTVGADGMHGFLVAIPGGPEDDRWVSAVEVIQ